MDLNVYEVDDVVAYLGQQTTRAMKAKRESIQFNQKMNKSGKSRAKDKKQQFNSHTNFNISK